MHEQGLTLKSADCRGNYSATSNDNEVGTLAVDGWEPWAVIIIIIIFFKPSKNEGRKKIEKVKKNGEANVPSGRPTQNYCATKQN